MDLHRPSIATLALLLVALTACTETPTDPTVRGNPAKVISDGANGGNPHVFFLPPMLPDPSALFSEDFDGSLDVEIMICVWNTATKACGPALEHYTQASGPGSETVRVPEGADHYMVNWHTDDILAQFPLGTDEDYRIRVLVGNRVLAYADVQVVGTAKDLKNVNTGEYIPLLDGRTLPIKVRIEAGWETYGAVETLEAGGWHTCSLTAAGAAWCWGYGEYGQLGNNSTTLAQTTPVAVAGNLSFTALSAGQFHTCGLTVAGVAYCWGYNFWGQLGNNSIVNQGAPVMVSGGHTFIALTAGSEHTCGLTQAGAAWCWGSHSRGQGGIGGFGQSRVTTPTAVSGGHTFIALSAGGDHTCGVVTGGAAYCWGFGLWGQLGNNSQGNQTVPVAVAGGLVFVTVSAGGRGVSWGSFEQTCGLTAAGVTYCWGRIGYFLNGSSFVGPVKIPTLLPGAPVFVTLDVSGEHGCGLTAAGQAYCWGDGFSGQLGTGGVLIAITPVVVSGGRSFVALSVGVWHSCGVTAESERYCWGYGGDGALGTGNTSDALVPTAVVEPPGGW